MEQSVINGLLNDIVGELDNAYILDNSLSVSEGQSLSTLSSAVIGTAKVLSWGAASGGVATTTNNYASVPLNWTIQSGKIPSKIVIGQAGDVADVIDITLTSGEQAYYTAGDAPYFLRNLTYTLSEV